MAVDMMKQCRQMAFSVDGKKKTEEKIKQMFGITDNHLKSVNFDESYSKGETNSNVISFLLKELSNRVYNNELGSCEILFSQFNLRENPLDLFNDNTTLNVSLSFGYPKSIDPFDSNNDWNSILKELAVVLRIIRSNEEYGFNVRFEVPFSKINLAAMVNFYYRYIMVDNSEYVKRSFTKFKETYKATDDEMRIIENVFLMTIKENIKESIELKEMENIRITTDNIYELILLDIRKLNKDEQQKFLKAF